MIFQPLYNTPPLLVKGPRTKLKPKSVVGRASERSGDPRQSTLDTVQAFISQDLARNTVLYTDASILTRSNVVRPILEVVSISMEVCFYSIEEIYLM